MSKSRLVALSLALPGLSVAEDAPVATYAFMLPLVQHAFTSGAHGRCGHCKTQRPDGACMHRKRYTLHGQTHALCDAFAFWLLNPTVARLPAYLAVFDAFYPPRRRRAITPALPQSMA